MRSRDLRQSRVGTGGALLLALLVLGAGLCLFDHDGDGHPDHGICQDLCWVMLVLPSVTLTLAGLVAREWVSSLRAAEARLVLLSIPDPPPRRSLLT